MIRFGKSSADYIRMRKSLVGADRPGAGLEGFHRVSALYRSQPRRERCVVCSAALGPSIFTLFEVGYTICPDCGHFNGLHEDTAEFARALYEQQAAAAPLSETYGDGDAAAYARRLGSVYTPKAEFLRDALCEAGEDPAALTYADLGAGAGHFVAAMRQCGMHDSTGYETSADMVDYGNRAGGGTLLHHVAVDDIGRLASEVDADVLTMIFSLEHICGLSAFLMRVRENPRLKYFYFAVPVYGPSVFLEALFPDTTPRVLGNGHTHLFTDRSIDRLCALFGMRRLSEWWFGATAFDVLRYVSAGLSRRAETRNAVDEWSHLMIPLIDDLQLAIDRRKLASEVHMLVALEPVSAPR